MITTLNIALFVLACVLGTVIAIILLSINKRDEDEQTKSTFKDRISNAHEQFLLSRIAKLEKENTNLKNDLAKHCPISSRSHGVKS